MAYLYLRYRSRVRVKQVLIKEYKGHYSNAGSAVVLNTFAAFLAIAMFGLVLGALISPVVQWLRN
ncbi:hypothetical protein [Hymenobacter properus]|uniref:Uncharacterized protein n=1 Tax=Hymenobacter properus TaxID=2791026 RepID=A0A931BJY0_9BACT|nr:hypothetical protein [Hymenobacter properus]MBF9143916.1 hypothetical protein [Hymenobacter properus]MBR7722730.1 hypothetical protein [Microvirga sp. SRT04]